MIGWFQKKEKEDEMKKSGVVFKRSGDGVSLARDKETGVLSLRAPLPYEIPSGSKTRVNFKVSCNRPVHVFQSETMRQSGLELVDGVWACQAPETEIFAEVINRGRGPIRIGAGEVVAHLAVLDNFDLEFVEK